MVNGNIETIFGMYLFSPFNQVRCEKIFSGRTSNLVERKIFPSCKVFFLTSLH